MVGTELLLALSVAEPEEDTGYDYYCPYCKRMFTDEAKCFLHVKDHKRNRDQDGN